MVYYPCQHFCHAASWVKEMCTEHRLVPEGLSENSAANLHGIAVVHVRLKSRLKSRDKCNLTKEIFLASRPIIRYNVQNYVRIDKKCHEITCFFVSAQISIGVIA